MNVEKFVNIIDSDFYTGVPDSRLRPLCDYLMNTYGIDRRHHIIGANEGNCAAIAAGYHLTTGKTPVVYMQNSGEGNIINPLASLLNEKVYAIPTIFIIGWRGEPGVHDEPQHIFQGEVTVKLMEDMNVKTFVVDKENTEADIRSYMNEIEDILRKGRQAAFIIKEGSLEYTGSKVCYSNAFVMNREKVIQHITRAAGDSPIISTTGKISRELFESRTKNRQSHNFDFLTVGSMGHCSSIALGVAVNKPDKKIWCIDGDGAALMHMGAMALIGANQPDNMIHIVINNAAHESVGGMPTVSDKIDFVNIAKACGYKNAVAVDNYDSLDTELNNAKNRNNLSFIEVKCALGARSDLGRPTTSAIENKENFMDYLMRV